MGTLSLERWRKCAALIVMIVVIGNDRRVMGSYTNGWALNLGGVAAVLVMTTAAVALVWFSISAIHI